MQQIQQVGSSLEAVRGLLGWDWGNMASITGFKSRKSYWETINGFRSPREREFERLIRAGVNRSFLHDQTVPMLTVSLAEFLKNAERELVDAIEELKK